MPVCASAVCIELYREAGDKKSLKLAADLQAARSVSMKVRDEETGQGTLVPHPQKIGGKYFSGKYHANFGHFVEFSYIYFPAIMSCPQS